MKNITKILSLLVIFFFIGSNFANADVADRQTYTINIPSVTVVELSSSANDFGFITANDFGNGNTFNHIIVVGDGSLTSSSYVQSNDPTATSKQYQLNFAPNGGGNVDITDGGSKAVLTLTNASSTTSVDINLTNNAQNAYPGLGDSSIGPIVPFVSQNADTLNIPANSNVAFNSTNKKAPLDMVMDLDENSLSIEDAAGTISFDMTLTIIGLN